MRIFLLVIFAVPGMLLADDCREIYKIDAMCQHPNSFEFLVISTANSWAIIQGAEERLALDADGNARIQVCEVEDNRVVPCKITENSSTSLNLSCEYPSHRGEVAFTLAMNRDTQTAQMHDYEDDERFELKCLG